MEALRRWLLLLDNLQRGCLGCTKYFMVMWLCMGVAATAFHHGSWDWMAAGVVGATPAGWRLDEHLHTHEGD